MRADGGDVHRHGRAGDGEVGAARAAVRPVRPRALLLPPEAADGAPARRTGQALQRYVVTALTAHSRSRLARERLQRTMFSRTNTT